MPKKVDNGWTAVQLKEEARERGLTGYSKLNKPELIELLNEHGGKAPAPKPSPGGGDDASEEAEIQEMTVKQLREYAADYGIDLAGLRLRADIVAAVLEGRAGTAPRAPPPRRPAGPHHPAPDFEAMTVPQLRAYAEEHHIDLTGLKLRADILEAVAAGPRREPRPAPENPKGGPPRKPKADVRDVDLEAMTIKEMKELALSVGLDTDGLKYRDDWLEALRAFLTPVTYDRTRLTAKLLAEYATDGETKYQQRLEKAYVKEGGYLYVFYVMDTKKVPELHREPLALKVGRAVSMEERMAQHGKCYGDTNMHLVRELHFKDTHKAESCVHELLEHPSVGRRVRVHCPSLGTEGSCTTVHQEWFAPLHTRATTHADWIADVEVVLNFVKKELEA